MRIIDAVVSQHAEEASFLWLLRSGAVHAPHHTLADLARLDGRLEAHRRLRELGTPAAEIARYVGVNTSPASRAVTRMEDKDK